MQTTKKYLQKQFRENGESARLFLLGLYARCLVEMDTEKRPDDRALFDEWLLDTVIADIIRGWGVVENRIEPSLRMIRIACGFIERIRENVAAEGEAGKSLAADTGNLIKNMFRDSDVQTLLQVNSFQNDLYFSKEEFESYRHWLTALILWEYFRQGAAKFQERGRSVAETLNLMSYLPVLAAKAKYRLEIFIETLDQFTAK